ncbi:MAG: prenyltransferase [Lactobacillales bacterium]|jgi:1,4-dihydroxy-2-naphthoate octaprenyltransferase|nr:prenyltransferase [Lactobacillales bacterium]
MSRKVFFELVEIKAKTASVFPFLLGLCYSWFQYRSIHLVPLMIYFVAMVLFNMFVDAWDNYNDYHHAVDVHDYKQNTNVIGREKIDLGLLKRVMGGLFFSSLILGLVVALMTGFPVLWLGMICYAVGIFYSAGPRPLSSLPVGEVFSGLTMGFLIFLICVFINTYQVFTWNLLTLAKVFLVALPNTLLIANLMLANNTCDLEEDESNHRYTLVHYIGKRAALQLWLISIIFSFLAIVCAVFLKLTPWTMLLNLLLLPVVVKQSRLYLAKQVKKETFICSVKILAIMACSQVVFFGIGLLF